MMPLLPFVAGLFAGAAAVSALRSEHARSMIDDTGSRLRAAVNDAESSVRTAAQSGLAMLRRSSPETAVGDEESAVAAASPRKAPAKKPVRARKSASPPPAAPTAPAAKAKPRRAPRKPKPAETEA